MFLHEGGWTGNLGMPISVWKCFNFSSLFGKMMHCCISSICWKKYEISQLLTHSYILWETEMFVSMRSYLVGIFVVYIFIGYNSVSQTFMAVKPNLFWYNLMHF